MFGIAKELRGRRTQERLEEVRGLCEEVVFWWALKYGYIEEEKRVQVWGQDESGLSEKDVLVGSGGWMRVGWPNWKAEYLRESGR